MAADVTVFDWHNIKDNNTVTETDRAPTGIEEVFLNGVRVLGSGRVNGIADAGKVLRQ